MSSPDSVFVFMTPHITYISILGKIVHLNLYQPLRICSLLALMLPQSVFYPSVTAVPNTGSANQVVSSQ